MKKRLPKYLKKEGIQKLIEATEDGYNVERNKTLIWFMYTTGLRVSEVEQLNIEDIASNGNIVESFQLTGKGGQERIVIIPNRTREILKEYLEDRIYDFGPVFIHGKGNRFMAKGIREVIKRIAARGNVTIKSNNGRKFPTPHTLRHSFAVNLVVQGVDITKIQRLLGHSNLATTEIYIYLNDQDLINNIKDVNW